MSRTALFSAALEALAKVREPRGNIGFGGSCHDMVLDLLERANLVTVEETEVLSSVFPSSEKMANAVLAGGNSPVAAGQELGKLLYEGGLILGLHTPAQNPAHSLVTMGNYMVAGYNNWGSTKNRVGGDFQKFKRDLIQVRDLTVRYVEPGDAAQRIKNQFAWGKHVRQKFGV